MNRWIIFQGRKIQVAQDSETTPAGRLIHRDVVIHPGAVAILPLVDADSVCLLRNVRPIVGATLWEIPAGTLEPGESPDQAATRELLEETGYTAQSWRKLSEFYPSPGVLSEKTHLYLAADLTPGPQRLEADEQIETHIVKWRDALAWANDGTIQDAKTLTALLLWTRLRRQ